MDMLRFSGCNVIFNDDYYMQSAKDRPRWDEEVGSLWSIACCLEVLIQIGVGDLVVPKIIGRSVGG